MAKKKKASNKPPSRVRYDAENTSVSAKLTRDRRELIRKRQRRLNQSVGDMFDEWLQSMDTKLRDDDVAYEEGRKQGRREGFKEARGRYGIPFKCNNCKEVAFVQNPHHKKFLSDAIEGFEEWVHDVCPTRKNDSNKK